VALDFGDGSTSTEQNPTHVYEELGDYVVTLTSTSLQECSSTSSVNIGVITGIEQSIADSFEIYPNPVISSDKLIVRVPQGLFAKDVSIIYFTWKPLEAPSIIARRTKSRSTLDVASFSRMEVYVLIVGLPTDSQPLAMREIAITR
jgi:hypothetical protein